MDLEMQGKPRTSYGSWVSPDNLTSSEAKKEIMTPRPAPPHSLRILQVKMNGIRSCNTTACNSVSGAQKDRYVPDSLWIAGQPNDTRLDITSVPVPQKDAAYNEKNGTLFDVARNSRANRTPTDVSDEQDDTHHQHQIEGGAVSTKPSRLSLKFSLDLMRYEAVYNLSQVNSLFIREKIYWAWKYLERGTNIVFREPVSGDKVVIKVFEGNWCYSRMEAPFYVSLSSKCSTVHTVLHEILHSLGIIHEHQRHDRDKYIRVNATGLSLRWTNNFKQKVSEYRTDYDLASIMHYPEYVSKTQTVLEARDLRYKSLLPGSRSFLSSCDWALLNHLYPGPRKSFLCEPHRVFRLLVPRPGASVTETQCQYDNEVLFDNGLCVYKINSRGYPAMLPIEEELGFHPEEPHIQLRNMDLLNSNPDMSHLYLEGPLFYAAEGFGVSLSLISYAYVVIQLIIDVVTRD